MDTLECSTKGPNKGKVDISDSFRHWWQYFVVIVMFGLSLLFFCAGHVESIVFDKTLNELQLWRTSLYCVKKVKRYHLSEIADVRAYKRGHNGVNVYTLHYKIVVIFSGNS